MYDRSDAAPVTVRYVDTEGNQLAEPSILGGKVGLSYESEAKEIPGWYVTETPDNASWTFTEDPQEVLYIYDIQANEEIDSENPTPDPEGETDAVDNLPNTGENLYGQKIMIVLGMLLAFLSLIVIGKRKHSK